MRGEPPVQGLVDHAEYVACTASGRIGELSVSFSGGVKWCDRHHEGNWLGTEYRAVRPVAAAWWHTATAGLVAAADVGACTRSRLGSEQIVVSFL